MAAVRMFLALCLSCVFFSHIHAASVGTEDVEGYLRRYGYLEAGGEDRLQDSGERKAKAIREFQTFAGLPVTGVADDVTLDKMAQPRCGYPDKVQNGDQRYKLLGSKWEKDVVTWSAPQPWSSKMSHIETIETLKKAFQYWMDVANLDIRQVNGEADIKTLFARGVHNDGPQQAFDGPGRVLAHAYPPGYGMGGDTHFDEDENWSAHDRDHISLLLVATHEFGHALGLAHSDNYNALMAPFYRWESGYPLNQDDIAAITSLYGKKQGFVHPGVDTTIAPHLPWYCQDDFHVEAVSGGSQGSHFFFSGDKVFRTDSRGLMPGYPKPLTSVFRGGPAMGVESAVYIPETNHHYLFRGGRVWRFTGASLDPAYPRTWLNNQDYFKHKPHAALAYPMPGRKTRVYMFSGNKFWEWLDYSEAVVPNTDLDEQRYWSGAPLDPDAATADHHGNFFFFKGAFYWKLENRVAHDREPKPLGRDWFHNICRA